MRNAWSSVAPRDAELRAWPKPSCNGERAGLGVSELWGELPHGRHARRLGSHQGSEAKGGRSHASGGCLHDRESCSHIKQGFFAKGATGSSSSEELGEA